MFTYSGLFPLSLSNPSSSSAGIRWSNITFTRYHAWYFVIITRGFHKMLFSGVSSFTLNPVLFRSSNLNVCSLCLAALYTAGCAVSLNKVEKHILTQLTEQFVFEFHPLRPCMIIYFSNWKLDRNFQFLLTSYYVQHILSLVFLIWSQFTSNNITKWNLGLHVGGLHVCGLKKTGLGDFTKADFGES
jgi:hypothetical protein